MRRAGASPASAPPAERAGGAPEVTASVPLAEVTAPIPAPAPPPAEVPPPSEPTPAWPDDPFAKAARARYAAEELALEEADRSRGRLAAPSPEPTVASRDPGLVEFGNVDLQGPDPFPPEPPFAAGAGLPDPALDLPPPASPADVDPFAGLSDLGFDEPRAPAAPPPAAKPVSQPAPPAADVEAARAQASAAVAEAGAAADAEHSKRRLRNVGLNALSLVVLVALTAILFAVWRARSSAGPDAAGADAVTVRVESSPWETASGRPVVIVRGEVRAATALSEIRVGVELLEGGRAVASGRAVAGALPTAEEVHEVASAADAARLAERIAPRRPERVAPGTTLPFVAVVAEPPADLREVRVHVALEPRR